MTGKLDPLAEFAVTFRIEDAPADVIADARRQLLDAIGVIVGGCDTPPVAGLAAIESHSEGRATFLGRVEHGTAESAALVNASAGVWLDYDSGQRFSGSHPAIHAVPAALAIAEESGANGSDLLAAIIVGCEVGSRIGVAAGRLRSGMSPHGGWAVLGAAAAVARLLGYDAAKMANALDIASTLTLMSSTSVHTNGANVRHLQAGLGAQRGVLAARLVEDGFTGEADGVLSTIGGFVTPSFNARRATIELGSRWEFLRGYYKRHACARFGHAAIDALLAIRAEQRPDLASIESIAVRTYGAAAGLTTVHPETELAAKFSLPHTLAAVWIRGDAGPASFGEAARNDSAIRGLAERVHLTEDAGYTALAPEYRPAEVTVTYRDGATRTVERLNASGENDDPDRDVWLAAKFRALVTARLGSATSEAIEARVATIETLDDVRSLTALTQPT